MITGITGRYYVMCFLMAISLSSFDSHSSSLPDSKHNTPSVETIFALATKKDVASLELLGAKIRNSSDRALRIGYWLSLYIAAPHTYEKQFVEQFPTDDEGIMIYLYEFETKRYTPSFLFSFNTLANIAKNGNKEAIRKILRVEAHSDGAVAEDLCDAFIRLLDVRGNETLKALSESLPYDRARNYMCLKSLSPNELMAVERSLERQSLSNQLVGKDIVKQIEHNLRQVQ